MKRRDGEYPECKCLMQGGHSELASITRTFHANVASRRVFWDVVSTHPPHHGYTGGPVKNVIISYFYFIFLILETPYKDNVFLMPSTHTPVAPGGHVGRVVFRAMGNWVCQKGYGF